MVEDEKTGSTEAQTTETAIEENLEEQDTAGEPTLETEPTEAAVVLNHKRGRMITAGLVTVVVVSLIAVVVAGIFQFSSKWLRACPTDLPVNDPSPKLWQEVVSQKIANQSLGVPEAIKAEAQFKKSAPGSKGPDAGAEENQAK